MKATFFIGAAVLVIGTHIIPMQAHAALAPALVIVTVIV